MLDSLLCTLVKLAGGLLCRLPAPAAVWLGRQCGMLAYWAQPKRTRIGTANLRAAFDGDMSPEAVDRTVRACYRHLGEGLFELLRLPAIDRAYIDRYITPQGREHFDAALATGRPIIFLTGHYGSWELCSIAAALSGYPIVALARAQDKFPKLYRLLVSYRESKGCTIIHKGGAMRRLIEALDQRCLVGIVGDQSTRQGIFADFFGRPARFASGPFELALSRDALILPVFIHRLHGPYHRLVIEPPLELRRDTPKDEAVRAAVEQFAGVLSRHIVQDPSQWLWMHRRWKHTSARRVLVLSDGKAGHVKQSLAVVDAIRERRPEATHAVVEVRWRHPAARLLAFIWSACAPRGWGAARCLRWTLAPDSLSLLRRYADVIVSCGSSLIPANLLWSGAHDAKAVVLMNPSPMPLRRFDLVIAPRHDGLPERANVVATAGALAGPMAEDQLARAAQRLAEHPKFRLHAAGTPPRPVVTVLIGGETPAYDMTPRYADTLITEVSAACRNAGGAYLVTTSRRTPPSVERPLAAQLLHDPRCGMALLAGQDAINGTMDGLLGAADVVVVTGESVSMISEACASGRHVIVVEPVLREGQRAQLTKHQRFLKSLAAEGYARVVPVGDVGSAIRAVLAEGRAPRRLDTYAAVRDAVGRTL